MCLGSFSFKLKSTKEFRERMMMMKSKTLLGLLVLIVFLPILFVVARFASDVPTFKEGPAPRLGDEVGSLRPESAAQIERLFEESGIPSMAFGIVVGDELVWAKGYGEQSDLSTVYLIGSINKTMITTAILQLCEQGLIDLDDDINEYLPYSVRHPGYPDVPITIRMLLSHSSGLSGKPPGRVIALGKDGPRLNWELVDIHHLDGPMVRWELVNNFNIPGLINYLFPPSEKKFASVFSIEDDEALDTWSFKPGIRYQYSNTAFYLLLASIIEEVSGQSYIAYLQEHVFAPLGMEHTSFEASDFSQAQLAIPYEDFSTNDKSDLPLTSMAASGHIRMNVLDLAKYLVVHMNEGALGDQRILEPESVALMHERHRVLSMPGNTHYINGLGLSWFLYSGGFQGHGGSMPGNKAEIIYNDQEAVPYGVVMMMTYGCSKTDCDMGLFNNYYGPIQEILFKEGQVLAGAEGN
jgi:CubicO group peptidase (beta-lactamase class C family)